MATDLHPTAVYCLLKGLVAVEPNFATQIQTYRIMHGGWKSTKRLFFNHQNQRWYVMNGTPARRLYNVVSIATIPYDVIDKLPPETVDLLVSTQEN